MLNLLKSLGYKLDKLIFNYLVKNKFILSIFGGPQGSLDDYLNNLGGGNYGDMTEGYDIPDDYYYGSQQYLDDLIYNDFGTTDNDYYGFDMGWEELNEQYGIVEDYDPSQGFDFDAGFENELYEAGYDPETILYSMGGDEAVEQYQEDGYVDTSQYTDPNYLEGEGVEPPDISGINEDFVDAWRNNTDIADLDEMRDMPTYEMDDFPVVASEQDFIDEEDLRAMNDWSNLLEGHGFDQDIIDDSFTNNELTDELLDYLDNYDVEELDDYDQLQESPDLYNEKEKLDINKNELINLYKEKREYEDRERIKRFRGFVTDDEYNDGLNEINDQIKQTTEDLEDQVREYVLSDEYQGDFNDPDGRGNAELVQDYIFNPDFDKPKAEEIAREFKQIDLGGDNPITADMEKNNSAQLGSLLWDAMTGGNQGAKFLAMEYGANSLINMFERGLNTVVNTMSDLAGGDTDYEINLPNLNVAGALAGFIDEATTNPETGESWFSNLADKTSWLAPFIDPNQAIVNLSPDNLFKHKGGENLFENLFDQFASGNLYDQIQGYIDEGVFDEYAEKYKSTPDQEKSGLSNLVDKFKNAIQDAGAGMSRLISPVVSQMFVDQLFSGGEAIGVDPNTGQYKFPSDVVGEIASFLGPKNATDWYNYLDRKGIDPSQLDDADDINPIMNAFDNYLRDPDEQGLASLMENLNGQSIEDYGLDKIDEALASNFGNGLDGLSDTEAFSLLSSLRNENGDVDLGDGFVISNDTMNNMALDYPDVTQEQIDGLANSFQNGETYRGEYNEGTFSGVNVNEDFTYNSSDLPNYVVVSDGDGDYAYIDKNQNNREDEGERVLDYENEYEGTPYDENNDLDFGSPLEGDFGGDEIPFNSGDDDFFNEGDGDTLQVDIPDPTLPNDSEKPANMNAGFGSLLTSLISPLADALRETDAVEFFLGPKVNDAEWNPVTRRYEIKDYPVASYEAGDRSPYTGNELPPMTKIFITKDLYWDNEEGKWKQENEELNYTEVDPTQQGEMTLPPSIEADPSDLAGKTEGEITNELNDNIPQLNPDDYEIELSPLDKEVDVPIPDIDGDGFFDGIDAFPDDPNENLDSDGDGYGDNSDVFPNDADEFLDSDNDGYGDNSDIFPDDPNEFIDSDGDGIGDNADAFPDDDRYNIDSDLDGVADEADYRPNDPSINKNIDDLPQGVKDFLDVSGRKYDYKLNDDGTITAIGSTTKFRYAPDDPEANENGFVTAGNLDEIVQVGETFLTGGEYEPEAELSEYEQDYIERNPEWIDNGDGTISRRGGRTKRNYDPEKGGFYTSGLHTEDTVLRTENQGDGEGVPLEATEQEYLDNNPEWVDNGDGTISRIGSTTKRSRDVFGAFQTVGYLDHPAEPEGGGAIDSDGDGYSDVIDALPDDDSEHLDTDGDGTGDNTDTFPDDPNENSDSDGDGMGDNEDIFPNDPNETVDSDNDGVGNNSDLFPDDPNEQSDADGDGTGDNSDLFPDDPNEFEDSDSDGTGDNSDIFPDDPSETVDSDNDGRGDNSDIFPNDPNEQDDSDNDGVGDIEDMFPNDPTETVDSDNDGMGDNSDMFPDDSGETVDSDNDGIGDNSDAFPDDADETIDSDGDGMGDNEDMFPEDADETIDSDSDGMGDNEDIFPNDPNETIDSDGDGLGDNEDEFDDDPNARYDTDKDGSADAYDAFPDDPNETVDTDGDGIGDNSDIFPDDPSETVDSDNDGVGDNADMFPEDSSETIDTDSDGIGDNADVFPDDADEFEDSDSDGIGDNADIFPNDPNETTDRDSDGIGDNSDIFPDDPSETIDTDSDGIGDNSDIFPNDPNESVDSDNDGVGDNSDIFPEDPSETIDTDGDGVGNNADVFPDDINESVDSDGDGRGDNSDIFPNDASEQDDTDLDGIGDASDLFPDDPNESIDSDLDGIGDNSDVFPEDPNESIDSDLDGVGDNSDLFPNDPNESIDSDLDGVGDNSDLFPNDPNESIDSDLDGVGDNSDIFPNDPNESIDTDLDGVGDNLDVFPNDPNETVDTDGDGYGDNSDAFVDDPTEYIDADEDGYGDNQDAFPNDPNEYLDTDGDGIGNFGDLFPEDATESVDSDGDGIGDNADIFPNDPNESIDTDGDGYGDNSDIFPNDGSEWLDDDNDGYGNNQDVFPNDNQYFTDVSVGGTGTGTSTSTGTDTGTGNIIETPDNNDLDIDDPDDDGNQDDDIPNFTPPNLNPDDPPVDGGDIIIESTGGRNMAEEDQDMTIEENDVVYNIIRVTHGKDIAESIRGLGLATPRVSELLGEYNISQGDLSLELQEELSPRQLDLGAKLREQQRVRDIELMESTGQEYYDQILGMSPYGKEALEASQESLDRARARAKGGPSARQVTQAEEAGYNFGRMGGQIDSEKTLMSIYEGLDTTQARNEQLLQQTAFNQSGLEKNTVGDVTSRFLGQTPYEAGVNVYEPTLDFASMADFGSVNYRNEAQLQEVQSALRGYEMDANLARETNDLPAYQKAMNKYDEYMGYYDQLFGAGDAVGKTFDLLGNISSGLSNLFGTGSRESNISFGDSSGYGLGSKPSRKGYFSF